MQQVSRFALVPYQPDQMYELVRNIGAYPDFLGWCVGADVLSENADEQLGELTVSLAGFRKQFSTRNGLSHPDRITMSLIDGPFKSLDGAWEFRALGEDGCRVALNLEFEFSHRLLSAAFEKAFSRIVQKLVSDFCQRAEAVYG